MTKRVLDRAFEIGACQQRCGSRAARRGVSSADAVPDTRLSVNQTASGSGRLNTLVTCWSRAKIEQILAWNPSSQPTHLRRASKRDGERVRYDITDSARPCARCKAAASTDRCEALHARHWAQLGHGFAGTLAEKKAVAPTTPQPLRAGRSHIARHRAHPVRAPLRGQPAALAVAASALAKRYKMVILERLDTPISLAP
jgi:hypothetical protein